MKILVITDTHGQLNKAEEIILRNPDITNIIHLGDMVKDAEELELMFPGKSFHKIKGNNDWCSFAKDTMVLSLRGHNIFATHGHLFGVRSGCDTLAWKAKSLGCNLALFGHTHQYEDKTVAGVRCLNPSNKGYFIITENEVIYSKY